MQQRRSNDGKQCGNPWRGLEKESKEVGSQRKSEEEEVKRLGVKEKDSYMKVGVKKLPRASKNVESPRSGDGYHGEVEIEETDGSSSRQKEFDFSVLVLGSILLVEVDEELSTLATQYWAEGAWTGKWYREQTEGWMMQIQEVQMWRQVRGPAGAVMCWTRDLGIKWPHWHTLIFGDGQELT